MRMDFAKSGLALMMLCASAGVAAGQDALLSELYGSGVHHYFSGDYQGAITDLTSAIDHGSKDPRAYYFRALSESKLGWQGNAQSDFQVGASLEAADVRGAFPVAKSLERVQGSSRALIERYRTVARVDAAERRQKRDSTRYEQWQRAEQKVLRDPAAEAAPATKPAPPTPPAPKPKVKAPVDAPPVPPPVDDPFADDEQPAKPKAKAADEEAAEDILGDDMPADDMPADDAKDDDGLLDEPHGGLPATSDAAEMPMREPAARVREEKLRLKEQPAGALPASSDAPELPTSNAGDAAMEAEAEALLGDEPEPKK